MQTHQSQDFQPVSGDSCLLVSPVASARALCSSAKHPACTCMYIKVRSESLSQERNNKSSH